MRFCSRVENLESIFKFSILFQQNSDETNFDFIGCILFGVFSSCGGHSYFSVPCGNGWWTYFEFFFFFFSSYLSKSNKFFIFLPDFLSQFLKMMDFVDIFITLNALLIQLSILSSYCFFADKMTNRLSDISDIVYNSEWNRYPKEIQLDIVRILQMANQPIYFTCLGVVNCNLESCNKVRTSSFLYLKKKKDPKALICVKFSVPDIKISYFILHIT